MFPLGKQIRGESLPQGLKSPSKRQYVPWGILTQGGEQEAEGGDEGGE